MQGSPELLSSPLSSDVVSGAASLDGATLPGWLLHAAHEATKRQENTAIEADRRAIITQRNRPLRSDTPTRPGSMRAIRSMFGELESYTFDVLPLL